MRIFTRLRLLAGATLPLALGGARHYFGSARADDHAAGIPRRFKPAHTGLEPDPRLEGQRAAPEHGAVPDRRDEGRRRLLDEGFKDSGLPEPRVSYEWIPAGQTAASACGDESGTLGDSAAAYCPGDDTIYISQKFATDIYSGALDQALPGSSQGYGRTVGDFAVAYIVAHEYGHEVQDELGLFDQYGEQVPTMAFELQADCYAGTWAKSANDENRLEDGDVQEALDAALAVGDFDTGNPGHHGTPEQREEAWRNGFESGDPSSCDAYLEAA